jgi:hypothetical protein
MSGKPNSLVLAALLWPNGLFGCSDATPVPPDLRSEALEWLANEGDAASLGPIEAMWLANGIPESKIVCGEISAPSLPENVLRFVYDGTGKYGQIELHSGWIAAPLGEPLLAQNRQLFDQLWNRSCVGFRP